MSVKALIDRIKPYAKGWSRTGTKGILPLIQEGQDELFNWDSEYMHFVPTTNEGFPPYLQTTDGTYRYSINATNIGTPLVQSIGGTNRTVRCRRVLKVFVDTSKDYDYQRRWLGDPYFISYRNPYRRTNERMLVADVPVRGSPSLENTEAYVEFPENPGTTTDIYFIDFIWEPPRLTAETIPLVVPLTYERALHDYALGMIEQESNGKEGERLKRFYEGDLMRGRESWVDKFRNEVDIGATIDDWKTQLKEC